MSRTKLLLISLYYLFFTSPIQADTLRVSQAFEYADLQEVGSLTVKPDNEEGAKEIITYLQEEFTPLFQTGITFRATQEVYWIKFSLINEDTFAKDLMLKIENPRINEVQFFTLQGTKIDSSILMGDHFPFQQRNIPNRNYLHPIHLLPNEVKTIYTYLNKSNENIELYASLWSKSAHEKFDAKEKLFLYLFFGFGFCISLFTLIAALFSNKKVIYYYAFYATFALLNLFSFHGLSFQFIWSNYPWFTPVGSFMFGLFSLTCLIGLTRSILDTSTIIPKYDKVFRISQWFPLVFLPLLIFEENLSSSARTFLVNFGNVYLPANIIFLLGAPILTYLYTRKSSSLIYLIGFLFYIGSFLYYFFSISGYVSSNNLTQFSSLAGLTIDLIILLLLISRQIRETYEENIRLQEDLLQSKLTAANTLLEGQLKERQRLSTELHDGVGLKLALIEMEISSLFEGSPKGEALLDNIGLLSHDIRSYTHAISPLNLNETSLEEAVEDLVFDVSELTTLDIQLDTSNFNNNKLTTNEQHAIYLTLKELLHNTVKHAKATKVWIRIFNNQIKMGLEYEDNGTGFTFDDSTVGIGLKNIESRAVLYNGNFEILPTSTGSKFKFLY
jgi:signal transduction histidine kinase